MKTIRTNYVNGVKISQDLSVYVPACSRIDFALPGLTHSVGVYKIAVLPIRISDAKAISLTT